MVPCFNSDHCSERGGHSAAYVQAAKGRGAAPLIISKIGAFNVNNMEIIQGITEAAKEENAPLILQVSAGARKYANHTYLMKLIEAAETDSIARSMICCTR